MKRFKLLFMSLAVLSATSMSSCKDDEENPKPSLTLKSGAGYTYSNGTRATGSTIKIGAVATGTETLKRYTIRIVGGGIIFDTTFSSKSFDYDHVHTLSSTVGNETFSAQIEDVNGETAEQSFTITKVQNEELAVRTVTLPGQGNADPVNFFSATTADQYNLAGAKTNQTNVDWVYFFGSTNKATISSPDNLTDLNQIYSSNADRPETWTTRNSTRFRMTNMTTGEFDAIATGPGSNNTIIHTEYSKSPVNAVKANNLTVGQVWIFETRTNKPAETIKGLFKVTAVPSDDNGSLEVVVKMETN